jgi:glycosyltransferase involved in cell wall biosynthesis
LKKICLITTSQPSVNPRLVKEADSFAEAGYDVTVLYCYVADWAQQLDIPILARAKWKYLQVGGKNKSEIEYRINRFFFACFRFINEKISSSFFLENAHARCYNKLLTQATSLKADWYIGHNPGAMAIAANAAFSVKALAGFDFEDYHRGEFVNVTSPILKRQILIENKYIKYFNYLSAASILIKNKIDNDFPALSVKFITLLNCFSKKEMPEFTMKQNDNLLHLFWVSQHINKNRGLQIVCEALKEINDSNIHITVAGNCTDEMKNYFVKAMYSLEENIHFAGLVEADKLISFSSQFDVGLALETGFSENNNVALSNKIFTYLQAGNALILSETDMQRMFNNEYNVGKSFPINNKETLIECIKYFLNKNNLAKQKLYNRQLAKEKLNWENESKKLIAIIN